MTKHFNSSNNTTMINKIKQFFAPKANDNSLFVINAYLDHEAWVFDDELRGLHKEPFVAGADTVIDILSGRVFDDNVDSCTLLFSDRPFPSHTYKMAHVSSDGYSGNWYTMLTDNDQPSMKFWLCPALLKFFDKAPNHIYVQAK